MEPFKIVCISNSHSIGTITVKWTNPLSDADVKNLGLQLASALTYCHSQGVVHGRVLPEKFLFNKKKKHLSD